MSIILSKYLKILFFCMIIVENKVEGQQNNLKYKASKAFTSISLSTKTETNSTFFNISAIPPNFYTKNLSFFCRQELRLEKAAKVAFKFRLGSVEQCDWLEGKKQRISP